MSEAEKQILQDASLFLDQMSEEMEDEDAETAERIAILAGQLRMIRGRF